MPAPKRGYVHTIDVSTRTCVQLLVHGEDGKKFDPHVELQNFARLEPR